jgi:hypothetical protein
VKGPRGDGDMMEKGRGERGWLCTLPPACSKDVQYVGMVVVRGYLADIGTERDK